MNNSLLDKVLDPDTLRRAWLRIRSKGAGGGSDGLSVADVAGDATTVLADLARDLAAGAYVPEPLKEVRVPKGPGKEGFRILRLPSVRDKIAQEAVRSAIEPRLEALFLDCSYGYRRRRGPQRAVRRVSHYLVNQKCRLVARGDIDDFFHSVSHQLLLERLAPLLGHDEAILRLIELWLRMGAVDRWGRWRDVHQGVGQGGVLSPLLANLYLHPFDERLTEEGYGLVRYADDFVILCPTRDHAESAFSHATAFLREKLLLRLNEDSDPIRSSDGGFPFLGILFKGHKRVLDPDKEAHIRAGLRHLAVETQRPGQDVSKAMLELGRRVQGWGQYYGGILPAECLRDIEAEIRATTLSLATLSFARGKFKSTKEAIAALTALPSLLPRSPREQTVYAENLAREARAAASSPRRSNDRRPHDSSAGRAVRRKKRQKHKQASRDGELVVETPGQFIGKSRDRITVRQERRIVAEMPAAALRSLTVRNHGVSLSSDVVCQCARAGVPILFATPTGDVEATLISPARGDGALQIRQLHAAADGETALRLARAFAGGKIRNQLSRMKYFGKYRKGQDPEFAAGLCTYSEQVRGLLQDLGTVRVESDYEQARTRVFSAEGRAAAGYWAMVRRLLRKRVAFEGRVRKGAKDPVNMLLNYGYAVLRSRVYLAILRAGLVPEISFLHAPRPGRPSLAFDLMEEFRPQVVDRTVFSLFSLGRTVSLSEDGLLDQATRRLLLDSLFDRLGSLLSFRGKEQTLGEVIQCQARALGRDLKMEGRYRPFLGKW